jgi:nucleotide-binding universal stress UspA family protein
MKESTFSNPQSVIMLLLGFLVAYLAREVKRLSDDVSRLRRITGPTIDTRTRKQPPSGGTDVSKPPAFSFPSGTFMFGSGSRSRASSPPIIEEEEEYDEDEEDEEAQAEALLAEARAEAAKARAAAAADAPAGPSTEAGEPITKKSRKKKQEGSGSSP